MRRVGRSSSVTPAVFKRPPTEREEIAKRIGETLDPFLVVLGFAWLLAWTLEPLFEISVPGFALALVTFEYAVWILFVVEFLARVTVDPSTRGFLKRRWWELVMLAIPVFRFLRIVGVARVGRVGRAGRSLAAAAGIVRSAERTLFGRIAMLLSVTLITILVGGRLLYEFDPPREYGSALHSSALAALANEPVLARSWPGVVIEIALVIYAIIVFAGFAGALGAYFLKDSVERSADRVRDSLVPESLSGPTEEDGRELL